MALLSYDGLHRVGEALATLEAIGKLNAPALQITEVVGEERVRKPRSDKKDIAEKQATIDKRELNRQQQIVLDFLREKGGPVSVRQIVTAVELGENSVRPHLSALHRRNLVEQTGPKRFGEGTRPQMGWRAVG